MTHTYFSMRVSAINWKILHSLFNWQGKLKVNLYIITIKLEEKQYILIHIYEKSQNKLWNNTHQISNCNFLWDRGWILEELDKGEQCDWFVCLQYLTRIYELPPFHLYK